MRCASTRAAPLFWWVHKKSAAPQHPPPMTPYEARPCAGVGAGGAPRGRGSDCEAEGPLPHSLGWRICFHRRLGQSQHRSFGDHKFAPRGCSQYPSSAGWNVFENPLLLSLPHFCMFIMMTTSFGGMYIGVPPPDPLAPPPPPRGIVRRQTRGGGLRCVENGLPSPPSPSTQCSPRPNRKPAQPLNVRLVRTPPLV